jgi:type 1 glutamine amidotransferase
MMGGFFAGHPFGKIKVRNDDPKSPINAAFKGEGFDIQDEMYTFREPYSREKQRVLLSIDISTLQDDPAKPGCKKGENRQDHDYAISWIREQGKGRVFYCSFGHQHQIWWTPTILQHYLDGMQYSLGDLTADATPSVKK